jgi:hypothetical protein
MDASISNLSTSTFITHVRVEGFIEKVAIRIRRIRLLNEVIGTYVLSCLARILSIYFYIFLPILLFTIMYYYYLSIYFCKIVFYVEKPLLTYIYCFL